MGFGNANRGGGRGGFGGGRGGFGGGRGGRGGFGGRGGRGMYFFFFICSQILFNCCKYFEIFNLN